MNDFDACISTCDVEDVPFKDCNFPWCNRKEGFDRIYCKLDRIMSNVQWFLEFPNMEAEFLAPGIFYHWPSFLSLQKKFNAGPKSFKFHFFQLNHPDYSVLLQKVWSQRIQGIL
ncbi:hypothetical protein ACH5RR_032135 [Cinchona calisaya]|uniref:Uncharacterized protein n=1 Tax=Cinchona calisaya TaxID=153742 RepID=A0ABD2YIB1_9GENT